MKKILLSILLFSQVGFAQIDKTEIENIKKESASLGSAIGETVLSALPGNLFYAPKSTYLEGYGIVFMFEAILEPPRNPFSSAKTPQEVRATVNERRKQVTQKLQQLLMQRVKSMQSIGPNDSVTIVVYLINSNPADVPDLPGQIILTVKKQDSSQVVVREF